MVPESSGVGSMRIQNIGWNILFFFIKILPKRVCVIFYHYKVLGISKLAEIKNIPFIDMYEYIKKKHGIYLEV